MFCITFHIDRDILNLQKQPAGSGAFWWITMFKILIFILINYKVINQAKLTGL